MRTKPAWSSAPVLASLAGLLAGVHALAQAPTPTPPAPPPAAAPATKAPAVTPTAAAGTPSPAGAVPVDAALPKKPRRFLINGEYRELKKGELRPYYPPKLEADPVPQPSTIKVIEVSAVRDEDPIVLARPDINAPMIGTVVPGTRIAVRGELTVTQTSRYCRSKRWVALVPTGWMCVEHGVASDQPASIEPAYRIVPGERIPHRFVMVSSKEPLPMWANVAAFREGVEPERMLEKGDSIAVDKTLSQEGERYWISAEGKVLPTQGTYQMGATSRWHGILISEKTPLPFGWVLGEPLNAYALATDTKPIAKLPRRTRVDILEETTVKNKRFLRVRASEIQESSFPVGTAPLVEVTPGTVASAAPGAPIAAPAAAEPARPAAAAPVAASPPAAAPSPAPAAGMGPAPAAQPPPPEVPSYWVAASLINEVRLQKRPEGMGSHPRWFDADLGEQVLVAYESDKPVYATLVSSGRLNATPLGNYPVWARVTGISMKSQPYDEKPYFVNLVPWSTFFQAHNAIHGAYWHDRFGAVKSHGCINVSPLDARFVFEWLDPKVPPGWTSLRPADLRESPTLHVWDSGRKVSFKQERPIGPPDRGDEAERMDVAEKKRAAQLAADQAAAAETPAAGTPAPAPAATPPATATPVLTKPQAPAPK